MSKHPILWAVSATLATTGLLLLGNGLHPIWQLMWLAPLPVLLFAAYSPSWRLAGGVTALAVLLGSLTMLYYFHSVLRAPVIAWFAPFSVAALLFACGVLLFRALLRRGAVFRAIVALPAFWTVCEYAASFVPANGTAGSFAYTQLRCLPVLQVASLAGPWGITFLLLLVPTAIAAALFIRRASRSMAFRVGMSVGLVLAGVFLFGVIRLANTKPSQTVSVGLLVSDQTLLAETPDRATELSTKYAAAAELLAARGARIIVMPEKTLILHDTNAPKLDRIFQEAANRTGATLLIGVVHIADQQFNEARIYSPHAPTAAYHKQHLLAPFESAQTPGTSVLFLPGVASPVGVAICKDMDFLRPALDYGLAGTALMLDPAWDFNVDDVWHGHIAIMRGVENGYAVAHAAKEGLLTVTDNRGRILAETQSDSETFASLLVAVPLAHTQTVFDRGGRYFPYAAAALLLLACRALLPLRTTARARASTKAAMQ